MKRLKTLKDHVYDHIADQIRIGELRPEKKINENIICQELGISRTPVREALIQLAAEGVLNNTARKGFVIIVPFSLLFLFRHANRHGVGQLPGKIVMVQI